MRSGDVWKPIEHNTSSIDLQVWFACEYMIMGHEGMMLVRVGFLQSVNADDYHHCLGVSGDEGSTPAST